VAQEIFGAGSGANQDLFNFNADYQFVVFSANASQTLLRTAQLFRDPSAWYHIVVAVDTTQATASNRTKIYVNGVQVTAFEYTQYPSPNYQGSISDTGIHYISTYDGSNWAFDGYMAEVNFIDGQQLTSSSFGQTSATTGVWIPKKYTGTYGTNGFYLAFTDNSAATAAAIGKDSSGNGNNWTPNNISVTAGSTYDSMTDVPTLTSATAGNYGTLNPLYKGSLQTISNANLTSSKSSGTNISDVWGNFGMTSGKWYFECTVTALASTVYIGIGQGGGTGEPTDDLAVSPASYYYGSADGQKFYGSTGSSYGSTYGVGNVIGCAIDMDSGKIWWSKDGTWQASGDPAAGTNAAFTDLLTRGSNAFLAFSSTNGASNSNTLDWNFGQRPFAHTPPTGFNRLNTFNLPTPTIGATASTQANKYMSIATRTGNGSTYSVTGVPFAPDLVWTKPRSAAYDHMLADAVRGATKALRSNLTASEMVADSWGYLSAFNSDGYTAVPGSANFNSYGANGVTYVDWMWKANGSGSTNTAGSITSTVSANTSAGFSIVTWTGSGSTATIGHGLGVAPKMIIWMHRTNPGAYSHGVYHASLPSAAYALQLNLTNAQSSDNNWWNSTAPTSSVFTVGGYNISDTMVAYCFAPVAGYSAFGSYTGNGSSDGTFVYTGFRPRFVMIKSTIETSNWFIYDTARNTYNAIDTTLFPSASNADYVDSTYAIDVLSNGFKIRGTGQYGGYNNNGNAYVYACFAESPFKYSNAR
jgi:hypothetical protein